MNYKMIAIIENTLKDFISAIRYIMPESVLDSSLPENHCFCPFVSQVEFKYDDLEDQNIKHHIML